MSTRPLSPLNTNYDPPQPWRCVTHARHGCEGPVVGAVGAVPVCANGAVAEESARATDRARREALLADPEFQKVLAEEARIEQMLEMR